MTNIFALVEIKFQNDRIDKAQFDNYNDLKKQCANLKHASKITASEGFKLSLFRYPEDVSSSEAKESKPAATNKKRKTN
ncbi:hypothetical protein [Acinetobacter sp. V89_7]|uniref:hypothetical protein n=1 Tax=Acinetobacter sp. V89_7 TaxID=3044233 RepID=UPI00249E098C|nr:hypothetical protein [Acinetobacter sp. V89_7]MDI3379066.1 hypothetical protein [Acinetobacter sp. V89_7]